MLLPVPPIAIGRLDYDVIHQMIARLRQKQIFFVGGAAKSGTTWLQLLLNAHPEISCSGESHFVDRLLPALRRTLKAHNALLNFNNQSVFTDLDGQPLLTDAFMFYLAASAFSLILNCPAKAGNARIVGDKTPDNVRFFPLILVLFPQAKFIHIVRDARDCLVSMWFHNLRLNAVELNKTFSSLNAFAVHFAPAWVADVNLGVKFATEHPGRCLTMRYEDISQDPLTCLDRLCGYLGASRDPAVLQACCAAADFAKLSGGRPRGQEDRNSFFRRGVPGDWRNHFDEPTELALRTKVEPWLSRLLYL